MGSSSSRDVACQRLCSFRVCSSCLLSPSTPVLLRPPPLRPSTHEGVTRMASSCSLWRPVATHTRRWQVRVGAALPAVRSDAGRLAKCRDKAHNSRDLLPLTTSLPCATNPLSASTAAKGLVPESSEQYMGTYWGQIRHDGGRGAHSGSAEATLCRCHRRWSAGHHTAPPDINMGGPCVPSLLLQRPLRVRGGGVCGCLPVCWCVVGQLWGRPEAHFLQPAERANALSPASREGHAKPMAALKHRGIHGLSLYLTARTRDVNPGCCLLPCAPPTGPIFNDYASVGYTLGTQGRSVGGWAGGWAGEGGSVNSGWSGRRARRGPTPLDQPSCCCARHCQLMRAPPCPLPAQRAA